MRILVAVASKHGSTQEIGERIAAGLRGNGRSVDFYSADQAPPVAGYDAVIIGSAIYAGNWMGDAKEFVERNQAHFAGKPVWLFSSGPLGDEDPQPTEDPVGLDELMAATTAREHKIFVGSLDKDKLGLGEKLIVKAVKAPYGDFRDWKTIEAWANEIAAALEKETAVADQQ